MIGVVNGRKSFRCKRQEHSFIDDISNVDSVVFKEEKAIQKAFKGVRKRVVRKLLVYPLLVCQKDGLQLLYRVKHGPQESIDGPPPQYRWKQMDNPFVYIKVIEHN